MYFTGSSLPKGLTKLKVWRLSLVMMYRRHTVGKRPHNAVEPSNAVRASVEAGACPAEAAVAAYAAAAAQTVAARALAAGLARIPGQPDASVGVGILGTVWVALRD